MIFKIGYYQITWLSLRSDNELIDYINYLIFPKTLLIFLHNKITCKELYLKFRLLGYLENRYNLYLYSVHCRPYQYKIINSENACETIDNSGRSLTNGTLVSKAQADRALISSYQWYISNGTSKLVRCTKMINQQLKR